MREVGQTRPTLWLVAGPNGVGKTTYAFRHIRAVSGSTEFINLDEIARGLSPLDPQAHPQRAARVALEVTRELIRDGRAFSIETTLAGRTHLRTIAEAHAAGFTIHLLLFMVRNVDICLARIARRVAEGGHDVPEADTRRRFTRSIGNFPIYVEAVDLWRVIDNNGPRPEVVAEGARGCRSVMGGMDGVPEALADRIRAMEICGEGR